MNLQRLVELITHPVGKRLALAVALAAGIGITLSLFGIEQSGFSGLFTTFIIFIAVDLLMLTLGERTKRLIDVRRMSRENSTGLIKYSLIVFSILYFYNTHEKPDDSLVQEIQRLVEIFGLFAVLFYPVMQSSIRAARDGHYMALMDCVGRVLVGVAIYSVVLWLIGRFGLSTKEWVIENPTGTAVYVVTFVLVWAILKLLLAMNYTYVTDINKGSSGKAFGVPAKLRKPTTRDKKYIAAHEAGHVLPYAALGSIPPKLEIVVNENGLDGPLGFVSGIDSEHELNEKTFAEWHMLVLLAGQFGEEFAFSENTLGSRNDHDRWLGMARCYLSNHFDGIFYSEPINKYEQELNEEKLQALRNSQKELLNELFQLNETVHHDLTAKLLEMKRVGSEEIIPFLSMVTLPERFPLPLGEFEKFTEKWPSDTGLYSSNDVKRD